MAKKIDISGQTFGLLKAIKYSHSQNQKRYYECICECGNQVFISRKNLVKGYTKSCGCKWRLANKKHGSWKGHGDIPKDFYSNIRRGAESRSIEFNISIEYLWELLQKQDKKCALSGITLQFSTTRKDNRNKNISLDRIDSRYGYVEGNVQFIHKHINIMKNKFDENYFIELCKKIVKNTKIKNMEIPKNQWTKVVHVESSLQKKEGQFSAFIGRFQILHDGHKALFQQVLDAGGNVLIMIRDVAPDEKNPYTASEVFANIHDHYKKLIDEGRVKVIKIPDICSVDFGRGVGYDIVEWIPPVEIADISATKIREEMRKNGSL